MDKSVEDSIGQGVIADDGIPLVDGQLAGYQGGGGPVTVVHDMHEVVALCGVEGLHAPVIEDEQPGLGELAQECVVAAVGLGLGEGEVKAREATWPGLQTVIEMARERHLPGRTWRRRYSTISVPCPWMRRGVAQGIRRHWEVENKAHWVLDVAFKEDDSRIRTGDGAENVAIIRRFCLNLARLDGKKNSMRGKLKQAGWSDTRRAEILFSESA